MEGENSPELFADTHSTKIGEVLENSLRKAFRDAGIDFTPPSHEAFEKYMEEVVKTEPNLISLITEQRVIAEQLAADIPRLERGLDELEQKYETSTLLEEGEGEDESIFSQLTSVAAIQEQVQKMLQRTVQINIASVAVEKKMLESR